MVPASRHHGSDTSPVHPRVEPHREGVLGREGTRGKGESLIEVSAITTGRLTVWCEMHFEVSVQAP